MCVTLKLLDRERKRQEESVRRAEECGRLTRMMQIRRPSRPLSAGQAEEDTAQGTDHLISRQKQTNLSSSGKPLRECRSKPRRANRAHEWPEAFLILSEKGHDLRTLALA
jgi:hypothetical protein